MNLGGSGISKATSNGRVVCGCCPKLLTMRAATSLIIAIGGAEYRRPRLIKQDKHTPFKSTNVSLAKVLYKYNKF